MTRLVLAEVITMFGVLRVGGDFVCKTFELATQPMLQLCWLLHQSFERFTVVKPITSRPASSERYVIARGLREGNPLPEIVKHLENGLLENSSPNADFCFLPNAEPMSEDAAFLKFMTVANESITRCQIEACSRINAFAKHPGKRKSGDVERAIDPKQYYQCWNLGK